MNSQASYRINAMSSWVLSLLVLAAPAAVRAQFNYTVNNGAITITGYSGTGGDVVIPSTIAGLPVISIGNSAFANCTNVTNITIPDGITSIGDWAFYACIRLTTVTIGNSLTNIMRQGFRDCIGLAGVYFEGNAPEAGSFAFTGDDNATVYYLPGTMGWTNTYANRPTALWLLPYPLVLTATSNFGVQTNAFGFRISWATNAAVLVEASTTLADPVWSPVSTNVLTDGWTYFSDPQWTNHPARLYRVRLP